MASGEEMVILPIGTDTGGQGHIQSFTLSDADMAVANSVNYGQLKPIIMTMANMANVSEEVQVSSHDGVPMESEADMSDSNVNDLLRSHLVNTSTPKMVKIGYPSPYTSAVYTDSENGVTYEVVKGGTKRGGDRLIDSLGFTYNLKGRNNKNTQLWMCSVRNARLRCPAMVTQHGKTFQRGKRKHEHLVGQNTPKPHMHNYQKPIHTSDTPTTSRSYGGKKEVYGEENYKVIKGGSKAGMDLLRDKFGYTFTLKKLCKDGRKKYWVCSVRNRHLRCPALVIQVGKSYMEGSHDHKHMPGVKVPVGPHDIIPKHGVHVLSFGADDDNEDNDDDDGEVDDDIDASFGDGLDSHEHTYNRGSNAFIGYGTSPSKKASAKQRMYSRERKRKDHPTFLGPSCTINLTKCDSPTCNCKMVHCPFCDPSHFIPAKAGRVQDHLELTHFAHGVQYDDLMIVKCFQDCNAERNYGHYHCVFCFQQILKRNAYARHMLRHMRKMGIPDRLLVLPDSKFPDVINAYGFEIPICKKNSCQLPGEGGRHYHCPQCQCLCKERSLTVNHLWRCLQKKTEPVGQASDDEDTANTVEESQLNLHFSHFKSFNDVPLVKCQLPACCGGMYHCRLCPVRIFVPTYRQHLIAHYVTHWKQRVPYKGYSLLKCFQTCEGLDRSLCKVRYHFHCPICCKMIITKGSFEDHLKGCHLFKFGENLLVTPFTVDTSMEADVSLAMDMASINDNVDYMEDRLTSQAIAIAEEKKDKPRRSRWSSTYGGKFRKSSSKTSVNVDKLMRAIKAEMSEHDYDVGMEGESDYEGTEETNLSDDILGLNIKEDEIFELGTVIFSEKLIQALKSAAVVSTVLGRVSKLTGTKLSEEDGQYILCGKLEDLVAAKRLMVMTIQGTDSDVEEEPTPRKRGRVAESPKKAKITPKPTPQSKKGNKGSMKKEKETPTPVQRGRGRPKKTADDSFPYSEIKEIIAASKKTEPVKRGRGRPPKKLPVPSTSAQTKNRKIITASQRKILESPKAAGRYSTRGVKRNYLDMSAGRVEIKQEVISDDDDAQEDEFSEDEEEIIEEEPPTRGRGRPSRRGKKFPKKKVEVDDMIGDSVDVEDEVNDAGDDDIEEGDNDDDYLDDNEQETQELDEDMPDGDDMEEEIDSGDAKSGREPSEATPKKVIVLSPKKNVVGNRDKITDSVVKSLRTSNVQTSVPTISKVGIRSVKVGKRKQTKEEEEDALDKEMEKVTTEAKVDSLSCSLCDDFKADSFPSLTAHLKAFHHVYEPPRCDVCEMDFDTLQTLNVHIEKKHGPKPEPSYFKCCYEGCTRSFASQAGLTGHVNKGHLGQPYVPIGKKHNCDKCDYKTKSREDLWEHKRVAHDEQIECKSCNMVFVNYQTLKAHNDLKHTDDGQLICHICSKEFTNKLSLQKHVKQHDGPAFSCKICNKQISSKVSLNDHMERHKPELERKYRYYCAFCGKGFSVKSNYDDHQNKHTGKRPYKCEICSKTFGFRSMLKKHKTFVHSSERPFKCGFCMKGFKFMNLLKNHVTTHTNNSKHICTYCNKVFSTASSLKYHLKKCGNVMKLPNQPMTQQQNTIVMYTDGGALGSTSVISNPDLQLIGNGAGITETIQVPVESLGNIVSIEGAVTTDNLMAEAPVEAVVDTGGGSASQTEMEVYACSECNTTFGSFQEAEQHVLTAHPTVPDQ